MMMKLPVAAALAALALGAANAVAQEVRVIAKGYDPVAYFTEGKPMKGSPRLAYDWDEGRYYFASEGNRRLFVADPDRYAPRFGGYCTGSMAGGKKDPPNEGDGQAWKIVDGKLYLFGSVKWRDEELPGKPDTYQKARLNWEKKKAM